MPYRQLDADKIVPTVPTLQSRIEERFPGSGLGRVAGELLALGNETRELLAAVNDIETLTTSLSAKIWQKITLLGRTG